MAIDVRSAGWRVRSATRGGAAAAAAVAGIPPEFLTEDARVSDEAVLEPAPAIRGRAAAQPLDLTADVPPDRMAILAVRHPSGALTFHRPVESVSRGAGTPGRVRFQVAVRTGGPTRGIGSQLAKAAVVTVAKLAGDRLTSLLLPKLVAAFEKRSWAKRGLKEGWLRVTREGLSSKTLAAGAPVSPQRTLLFVHGTFSSTAAAFAGLAGTSFFDRVKDLYGDRIYGFDHFSLQRTPEENVRMLLDGLPEQTTTFDVITHSRGGLVLRTLVERARAFGAGAKRFAIGRAVLVAAPNNGTPLATPDRWDQTVGWIANLLELFPDNPFTVGAEFVANGLVWLANHASGDIPGLHAMDANGDPIHQLQSAEDPPRDAYSALVANYQPSGATLARLVDAGFDQFFGSANDLVVPSEGGWNVFHASRVFIPGARIGCFGAGGNLPGDTVNHVTFFGHQETADFLVTALSGRTQPLVVIDPRRALPDHRLGRGVAAAATSAATAAPAPAAAAPAPPRGRRAPAPPAAPPASPRLRITVTNGDLRFIPYPLLLGHYTSSELTGTERVMDRLIGGTMRRALQLDEYPVDPGTHRVFVNRYVDPERGMLVPRPEAVIVAGLGAEGSLRPADLAKTVRQAVIGWSRRRAEEEKVPESFELAATLIGSGGTGISTGQAAQAIAEGLLQANELLQRRHEAAQAGNGARPDRRWPVCSHLRLIELYLDRAAEAWRSLQLLLSLATGKFVLTPTVQRDKGGELRPPDSGYRGAPYDFVTVETRTAGSGEQTFEYTIDTRRARAEVRGRRAQADLIWELVDTASNDQNLDQRIGLTLANLVVPNELDSYLASARGIQISLDLTAASIPWELLDVDRSGAPDELPWSIRVKLLRQLKIDQFRERVVDANATAGILVIGEPETPDDFPRLEGARLEALRVHETLVKSGAVEPAKITLLAAPTPTAPRPDAQSIINAVFESRWRIVHIAGHGDPGTDGKPAGVVLSRSRLTSAEIDSMRTVPELVFINCCYLGQVNDASTRAFNRPRFASGVAGALIRIGVRCVLAAGWAVDDEAAVEFASTFYQALLAGQPFIDAVTAARTAARQRHPDVNTWAAYQCYGDPNWRYEPKGADANQADARIAEISDIATDEGLLLELDRIFTETKFRNGDPVEQVATLQALESKFGEAWGRQGRIAEGFGRAYGEAGAMDQAIAWYRRAIAAPDGSASMKAAEQLGNAQSRSAWEMVEAAVRHRDAMRAQVSRLGDRRAAAARKARTDARAALRDADRRLAHAIVAARRRLAESTALLRQLANEHPTMERVSLVGSAIKRGLMLNLAAGATGSIRRQLREMRDTYAEALRVGQAEKNAELHYPASNCVAADVMLAPRGGRRGLDAAMIKTIRTALSGPSADFWTEASRIELQQYEAIAARALGRRAAGLRREYARLQERATSGRMWASIYDNAWLVLSAYAQRASPKERDAAAALLQQLRGFAHPSA